MFLNTSMSLPMCKGSRVKAGDWSMSNSGVYPWHALQASWLAGLWMEVWEGCWKAGKGDLVRVRGGCGG